MRWIALLGLAQGNPLFLDQLLRHLQADPDALASSKHHYRRRCTK
jgi:hypothetical protein